ncbi:hypothetical protein SLA2020_387910 [Shorea laevis]
MPLHDQMIHQGCWMTTEPAEEYIVLAGLRKNWPKKSTEPAKKCLYLPKFTVYRLKSARNRPKLYRTDQTLHCLGRKNACISQNLPCTNQNSNKQAKICSFSAEIRTLLESMRTG